MGEPGAGGGGCYLLPSKIKVMTRRVRQRVMNQSTHNPSDAVRIFVDQFGAHEPGNRGFLELEPEKVYCHCTKYLQYRMGEFLVERFIFILFYSFTSIIQYSTGILSSVYARNGMADVMYTVYITQYFIDKFHVVTAPYFYFYNTVNDRFTCIKLYL